MRRSIIEIDESLCNGCGTCVDSCAEGAIQLVNGVARVVKESYCDGLGACVGDCPTGALRVVERDVAAYDARATEAHVQALRGDAGIRRMRDQAAQHAAPPFQPPQHPHAHGGGCPGSQVRVGRSAGAPAPVAAGGLPARVNASELAQWPIQLHLVPERAPFFAGKELVVMSTCGPLASADVHWRFLRGRSVVVACPKLDDTDPYEDKLMAILRDNGIPKVIVVRMEVPCCGGLTRMVASAAMRSGRKDLEVREVILGIDGTVAAERGI